MTLEEAIEQVERTYKENRSGWLYALKRGETIYAERCKKSMDEFGQLAEWLKELQERRKQIKSCEGCKWLRLPNGCANDRCARMYKDRYEAERRTDADD